MPKPLPRKAPVPASQCRHRWVDTKANGLVVHRRCQLCQLQLGVKPPAAGVSKAAPKGPGPLKTDPVITDLKTPLEMALLYQTALQTLVEGNVQSYTLPTGVTVTRAQLASVEATYRYWRKEAMRRAYGMKTVANMGLVWP